MLQVLASNLPTGLRFLFFLGAKEQTAFPIHNAANFRNRVATALKSHPTAAVRKNWIPGNIIINALVAINGHVSLGALK